MAVKIGSARIDERGRASGGAAGDQTGGEVSTQNWYLHNKGWRVLRPYDPAAAEKIASCMEAACANRHIGYDQGQRGTLYSAAKPYGFDVGKVTTNVETDCSALVRVCCAYAGISVGDFSTSNEASMLLKTGYFVEKTSTKYTRQSAYLKRGDILVTASKGHTVVVLTSGEKADAEPEPEANTTLGSRLLKQGAAGADVKTLQELLMRQGYDLSRYGADGEYGDETARAVAAFQRVKGLEADGEYGSKTHAALMAALEATEKGEQDPDPPEDADAGPKPVGTTVIVVAGDDGTVNVRAGNGVNYPRITTVLSGKTFDLVATAANGWNAVAVNGVVGWISGKYSAVI